MHTNYKERIQSILKNVIDEEFTMIKFKIEFTVEKLPVKLGL